MAERSRCAKSRCTRADDGASAIGASTNPVIEAIWRIDSPRVIAGLVRLVGDIETAEELAQDALVAALEQWPISGVPDKPGAWLMGTAKHRAIDLVRRRQAFERKRDELGRDIERAERGLESQAALDEDVGDDLLGLIFMACHPILATESRVALTLRVLGGLRTEEIARAFLVPTATIAQRIVRAKRTLAAANVRFEVASGAERDLRLASVLEVIYLIFNEGHAATAGERWIRPELCEEALRLGRVLAELIPDEGEVHGLVALMEIQASRLRARVSPAGEPILLLEQDRTQWDRALIGRGLAALERAERLGKTAGTHVLQAAIAACHARATTAADTDWGRIVALYDALAEVAPSPVVELNRAVAVGMAYGPAAGLELVEAIASAPELKTYHLLPAVRGDLLRKLGRSEEAGREFAQAASLTANVAERKLLERRAAECAAIGLVG